MAHYSLSTKTNKAATQSKSSSILASTEEKEHKITKIRWRTQKMEVYDSPKDTKIRCYFKFHLTKTTHKMLFLIVHFAHSTNL